MGSINCKEYTTKNEDCLGFTDQGTTGLYQSKSEANAMDEYNEGVVVCHESDLQENEMKAFNYNDNLKILLIKQNGKFSAIGNRCTHYGAPLSNGALGHGRVRCPWHGACFNIQTGDIEDFPGLDSVPCYKVQVGQSGTVRVHSKLAEANANKRLKVMTARVKKNENTYVIVGGGVAGGTCAETLRQEGFSGRIVMICEEKYLPYDRVKISKSMDSQIETIQFRDSLFYEENGIETILGVKVVKLDTVNRTIYCSDNSFFKYNQLFISTGCRPFKPVIPGVELGNIFTLRHYEDAQKITEQLALEKHVVCLGGSFIAFESASSIVGKVFKVTIIIRDSVPFTNVFGKEIGQRLVQLFRDNKVNIILQSGITEIIGNNDVVKEVVLKDGSKIPCDILILGTGSKMNTEFLKGSRVTLNTNGTIDTNMHLMTNIPDVYVGGDIANAPVFASGNIKAAIGHYQLAQYHGFVAGINMTGKIKELRAVPFFFTVFFGKALRYSGFGKFCDIYIDGDLKEMKFVAYYLDADENVVSILSCGRDPIAAQFSELKNQGKRLYRYDITDKEDSNEWVKKILETEACSL